MVDALGQPIHFKVTEGQFADCTEAPALIRQAGTTCLLADKGYDTDAVRKALAAQNCEAVIPSNRSRAQRIDYDREKYKARSDVERAFNRMKQNRRFATRFDKTLKNYSALVSITCSLLWLTI